MTPMGNPTLRLLALAKFKKKTLLLSALAAAFLSLVIGMMSPSIYRSEAVLKIEPANKATPFSSFSDPYMENQTILKDAEVLMYSQDVMNAVADELMAARINPDLAFPSSVRLTDIGFRAKLLAKRLQAKLRMPMEHSEKNIITEENDREVVASMIRTQMKVVTDVEGRMLRLQVDAADRSLAQRMCELIATKFLEVSLLKVQQELLRQEKYLVSTIDLQQEKISLLEKQLQSVKTEFSRLELRGNIEQPGLDAVGQIVERKGSLAEIAAELQTHETLYQDYRKELANTDLFEDVKKVGLREKIEKDLAEIEYKRLELVSVKGYPESHPTLINLKREADKLNHLLATVVAASNQDGRGSQATSGTSKELSAKLLSVTDRIKMLKAKKELLEKQLSRKESQMDLALDLETRSGGILRDLNGHLDILRELRRHLEETRMKIVGAVNTASLLVPPSFPLIPVSLSVVRRTFFGFFVGMVLALMVHFLFDFARPRLLVAEDLNAMKVHTFGTIRFDQNSIAHFVACLLTLEKNTAPRGEPAGHEAQTVLFSMINLSLNLDFWITEVAQSLNDTGYRVGVVIVQDQDAGLRRESTMFGPIEVTRLHRDEISFSFPQLMAGMRSKCDWILVLGTGLEPGPATVFLTRHADHLFYIARYGRSELGAIERIRMDANFTADVSEHALVMNHIM